MSAASRPGSLIIGAGLMGRWHAYYAARRGARPLAVVDPCIERARRLADRYGAAAWAELEPCLEAHRPRLAHLCSPSVEHFAQALALIDAGAHLLVEKPIAPGPDQVAELVSRAQHAGVRLAPAHQLPFQRGFARLLRRRSELGEPCSLEFRAATAGGDAIRDSDRRRVLRDILPHPLSLFAALAGPEALEPGRWRLLRFDSDAVEIRAQHASVDLIARISLPTRPRRNLLLYDATAGSAAVDLYLGSCLWLPAAARAGRAEKLVQPFRAGLGAATAASSALASRLWRRQWAYPGLEEMIEAFYRSAFDDGPPAVDLDQTTAIARVIDRLIPIN